MWGESNHMNYKFQMRCAIAVLSAIIIGLPALAVETGTGTNQMANLYATNSINLQGSIITSWTQVGSTADVAMVSNVAYGLDSRSNTWDGTAVTATGAYNLATGLEARSNAWNTGAAQAAGLNSRSNTWDAASLLAIGLETRSNAWNTGAAQAAGLNSRSNAWDETVTGKYDKIGGAISGNMTLAGKAVYSPGNQAIAADATTIASDQSVKLIGSDADGTLRNISAQNPQIAAGTAGQFLTVVCTNAGVKIGNGNGLKLDEGVSFTMGAKDVIQFVYDGANWVEIHRADNN